MAAAEETAAEETTAEETAAEETPAAAAAALAQPLSSRCLGPQPLPLLLTANSASATGWRLLV